MPIDEGDNDIVRPGKGVGWKNRYEIGVMSGGPGRASRYRCLVSNYKYFSVLSDLEILDIEAVKLMSGHY